MSTLSLRETYGEWLVRYGNCNKDIVVLDADLSKSTYSYLFSKEFPNRFFEMGIAEQNMISVAAGLAIVGKIPFVNSFAVFLTGRAFDQIRQSITLPKLNVKLCGSSAGLSDFSDGATHQSIEDIGLMCSLPNMTVLVPADSAELEKILKAAISYNGPVYIRINRNELPICTKWNDEDYQIGKVYCIRKGTDFLIFCNGVMVSKALEAAELLEKIGISLEVVNISTVKPLEEEQILQLVKNFKGVIVAEEHNIYGGLCSIISTILAKNRINIPISFVAIEDTFGISALSYEQLLEHYGLTVENIYKKVLMMSKSS